MAGARTHEPLQVLPLGTPRKPSKRACRTHYTPHLQSRSNNASLGERHAQVWHKWFQRYPIIYLEITTPSRLRANTTCAPQSHRPSVFSCASISLPVRLNILLLNELAPSPSSLLWL